MKTVDLDNVFQEFQFGNRAPLKELKADIAFREAKLRKKYGSQALKKKLKKCLGCGKPFGAREMRTHPCKIKTYPKRLGWVYSAAKGRYVPPEAA